MHKMIHSRTQNKASDWIRNKNTWDKGIFFPRNSKCNLLSLLSQRSLPECGQREAVNCYTTPTRWEKTYKRSCACAHIFLILPSSPPVPLNKFLCCVHRWTLVRSKTEKSTKTERKQKAEKSKMRAVTWAGLVPLVGGTKNPSSPPPAGPAGTSWGKTQSSN